MSDNTVLAIEGGGTKTRGWLAIGDRILAGRSEGPSNFQAAGPTGLAAVVERLADGLLADARLERRAVQAIGIGLAGVGTPEDRERVRSALSMSGWRVPMSVTSDARAALEGATRGAGGVLVISGTGSIALGARPGSVEHRAGGWGPMVSDEGSGFALGSRLVGYVTRELDGRAPEELTPMLVKDLGLRSAGLLEPWIRTHGRDIRSIAGLAPLVLRLSAENHPRMRALVENGVRALAQMVFTVHAALSMPADAGVVQYGGVLSNAEHYRERLAIAIAEKLPEARLSIGQADDGLRGCVLMAEGELAERTIR